MLSHVEFENINKAKSVECSKLRIKKKASRNLWSVN